MELLIGYCPESVAFPNAMGVTALHLAARLPQTQPLELVLQHLNPGNIDQPITDLELTALCIALTRGHTRSVELLLNHGANPNYINTKGGTLLEFSTFKDNVDIVKLLIAYGTEITPRSICTAIMKGFSQITQIFELIHLMDTSSKDSKVELIAGIIETDILTMLGNRYPDIFPYTLGQIPSPASQEDATPAIPPDFLPYPGRLQNTIWTA